MVELVAKSPAEGHQAVSIGEASLHEIVPEQITSLAPFKGQGDATSDGLKAGFGHGLPAVGRSLGKDGARVIWFGRGQWLILGTADTSALTERAAITDQSDAWCLLRLEGAAARDVLARLTTIDLRPAVFKRGATARTELQHMMASITRTGDQRYDVMVMRSMAATAWHDITQAMERVARTAAIDGPSRL